MHVTHAVTMNGHIHGELKDSEDTCEEVLRKRLALLDGSTRYAFTLWRLPDGVRFDRVDLGRWPQEFLQVAGSRDRMTVEVRQVVAGQPKQYVVGHRQSGENIAVDQVRIPWNGHSVQVRSSEVFDAAEAGEIFGAYYRTGSVPDEYVLRVLGFEG